MILWQPVLVRYGRAIVSEDLTDVRPLDSISFRTPCTLLPYLYGRSLVERSTPVLSMLTIWRIGRRLFRTDGLETYEI